MDILEATFQYEKWMAAQIRVVKADLPYKHAQMRESSFAFLRATFYRWIQLWKELCTNEASAPAVLAVGDLHIENFGTWRDGEGRLIWGIYDFDEAYPLPYTNDLVRLAASAMLAKSKHLLGIKPKDACEAILSGYIKGLETGGRPFVLEEDHKNLRALAFSSLRNPIRFWKKLLDQDKVRGGIPKNISKMFDDALPKTEMPYQFLSRVSGLGGLGRFRVVAITESQ